MKASLSDLLNHRIVGMEKVAVIAQLLFIQKISWSPLSDWQQIHKWQIQE